MKGINWQKALIILILCEIFWFSTIILHECVHQILFFLQSGSFGVVHFFDQVSFSYGTIAVTIPPTTALYDRTFHELCAYSMQIIATVIFALFLYTKYYLSSKSEDMIR